MDPYDVHEVETRWQARWDEDGHGEVDLDAVDPAAKFYNLVEFPYPSAEGLHVGHVYTYCGADTFGRYMRMRGRQVFQPMGFDSFGIHTENYALKVGENPRTLTAKTLENYRRQLRRLGAAWAWRSEIVTSDPSYYRWTQWIFLQLYRAGLAVRREATVVWCPSCLTVLAFEQLEGDRCERCRTPVTGRVMKQWFLRITAYADDLFDGLDGLDWPEVAVRLQREWIGRSRGVEVDFGVQGKGLTLRTFTTRPDTLFGVTFLAVPPDHPRLGHLIEPDRRAAVEAFTDALAGRPGRPDRDVPPRGVFVGSFAVHPATHVDVPIYVSDYVLASYGTGAVMGVPAHDQRDHAFAEAMGIPSLQVVRPAEPVEGCWTGPGTLVESGRFTGMASAEGGDAITGWLEEHGLGRRDTRYRLHDWLISRQRYWGPPIPIVYCEACGEVPVPEEDLPVFLPDVEEFRPTGTGLSPLAAVESFVATTCPRCQGEARRETDVSDVFLDSAWYFLRYPSAREEAKPWDPERTERLLPVDLYAGGPEHVQRHHLYSRFVTRALHDAGLVPFTEPFPRVRLHGLLIKDGAKMSKSRGNVVNPDEYIDRVGADALRMSLLFCGPWEDGGDFSDRGAAALHRFAGRVWRLFALPHRHGSGGIDLLPLERAVVSVGRDIERLKFNTAIATLMELQRWAVKERHLMSETEWVRVSRTFVLLLAPFAPHLAEELWCRLGGEYSVHGQRWPEHDRAALREDDVTMVIEVNGRVRDRRLVRLGLSREEAVAIALASPNVREHLRGREVQQVIHVPDRVVNLVAPVVPSRQTD